MKPYIVPIGGIVVLLLIVVAWSVFFYKSDSGQQTEEVSLHLTLGSLVDAKLFMLEKGNLREVAVAVPSTVRAGSVVSQARRGDGHMVATAVMSQGAFGTAVVLEKDAMPQKINEPSAVRDSIALSFDGSRIAYAELALPLTETLYSEEVDDWHIKVVDVATKKVTDLGTGYAPVFIAGNPDILAFSTPRGIITASLAEDGSSADSTLFIDRTVQNTSYAMKGSPDGKHLALYNALTKRYSIFSVANAEAFSLSAVGEIRTPLERVALSDTHLYGVMRDGATGTMTLMRYAFDQITNAGAEGDVLHTFTESEIPYQIIP